MNRKQLTLIIVLGVVIGGFGWYSYNKRQSSYERGSDEGGQKVLAGVPDAAINDVAHVTIRSNTNEVNLVRQADGWVVKERGNYPANFNNISDTVKKLWDLKVTRSVEVGPSRLGQLKLNKTDGTVVDLKDDKGKSIATLTLGLQATKESGNDSPFGGGSFPTGRYLMRGDDVKTVALVNDPLSSVEPKPDDWLNKDWLKVEKPKAVAVTGTTPTNTWKLVRESETGDWKLADAKAGEAADSSKTSNLNYLLSSPSFNDVSASKDPLTNATTATIETFDGLTYTLKIANAEGDNKAVQVAVAANLPKERTPGKDEKKEDKEKLDKEFADKQKQLQDKLKNEKKFEGWTYVVSNWTVEGVLKPRTDFLAEKKEEPKPEAGAATPSKPEEKKEADSTSAPAK